MIESGVGGPRIHQVGETQLANVAQPLENGRVDDSNGGRIQPDGVPERISDHTELSLSGHARE
jgi:hypothetical protein